MIQFQTIGIKDVELERTRITMFRDHLDELRGKWVDDAASALLGAMKVTVPKRSGDAAESLDYNIEIGPTGPVARFTGIQYLLYVIGGTGLYGPKAQKYPIWAGIYTGKSEKQFLHFFLDDGTEIFTSHVMHPGIKPDDFRKRAWRMVNMNIKQKLVSDLTIEAREEL